MDRRQYAIVVLFLTSLLAVALVPLSGQQGSNYNPWLDYNDDGIINVEDLNALGQAYGTSGFSPSKAALLYDSNWIDIHDKRGQAFNITHNLGRTDTIIDIAGKWALDGPVHRELNSPTAMSPEGWDSTINGISFLSMVPTTDGGYALAGETPGGLSDCILLKTDPMGVPQWNRTYGTAVVEYAYSVVQTADGGYALAGVYNTNGPPYICDMLLVKTDAAGNMEWNRTYGGTEPTEVAYRVIQTTDGGYALAGSVWATHAPTQTPDFFFVKTDPNGIMQWNQTYGGPRNEEPSSLIQTADGGYALAGYTDSYKLNDMDAWLIKTDSAGLVTWNRTYGEGDADLFEAVIQTFDGGYALAGGFWLVKTDAVGNMMWSKIYGHGGGSSLVQTIDGGYVMAGTEYRYPISIGGFMRTDPDGNELFSQKYPMTVDAMVKTNDGGYAMMGEDESVTFHLLKTNDWGFISFPQVGLTTLESTPNSLTLYRGRNDPYWNYVRVRIWVVKENP